MLSRCRMPADVTMGNTVCLPVLRDTFSFMDEKTVNTNLAITRWKAWNTQAHYSQPAEQEPGQVQMVKCFP